MTPRHRPRLIGIRNHLHYLQHAGGNHIGAGSIVYEYGKKATLNTPDTCVLAIAVYCFNPVGRHIEP